MSQHPTVIDNDDINIETVQQNTKNTSQSKVKMPHVSVPLCLGQMALLAMESPIHQHVSLNALKTMLLPAVVRGQFKIFHFKGKLSGFITWAYLSDESFNKYVNNNMTLSSEDWDSGERVWIMEVVAPFGHYNMIINELESFFDPMNCFMLMYQDEQNQTIYVLKDLIDQINKEKTKIFRRF